jgi:hypothetical protein
MDFPVTVSTYQYALLQFFQYPMPGHLAHFIPSIFFFRWGNVVEFKSADAAIIPTPTTTTTFVVDGTLFLLLHSFGRPASGARFAGGFVFPVEP